MNTVHKDNKVVGRAFASHAPGKRVLARGWQGKRGPRSKMRAQRVASRRSVTHRKAAFCPALRTAIGEPDRKLLCYNLNSKGGHNCCTVIGGHNR